MYFTARQDKCQRPDGVIVDPYFVVEMPTSACALPITADGNVVLVKQYRHPVGQTLIEIPGGFIDEGENHEQAIARELLEETGYAFTQFHYLGNTVANPGVLTNYTHLYLATGGHAIAQQQLDHTEDIEIFTVPLDALRHMIANNEIKQALHLTCMFYALEKLQRL
jgi:ADP-ribose pyrophosphatase